MTVIRRKRAVFEPVVGDRTLRRIAHDEVHLAMLRQSGQASAIRVPITVHGVVVAVVTLVLTQHRRTAKPRRFSSHDFDVAREIARQVSAELSRSVDAHGDDLERATRPVRRRGGRDPAPSPVRVEGVARSRHGRS
jgi:hypothetical protein